jgi:hypothetical protein
MNHPGEIAQLASHGPPTVALVNNAQREHQEFMATVEAVAQENGASSAPCRPTAWRCSRPTTRTRRCGATLAGNAPRADLCAQTRGRCHRHRRMATPTRPLGADAAHPGRLRGATLRHRRPHNVKQRAGRHGLRAGRRRAAGRHRRGAWRPSSPWPGRSRSQLHLAGRASHAGRRQLQRQPGLGARRHRRAGRAAGAALAGAGRHGRGRRPGPGLPCRGGRHARCRHRAHLDRRRAVRHAGARLRHFAGAPL